MKTSCVHHLAVLVQDLAAAADFYSSVLGLPEQRRWHTPTGELRSIWYSLGEHGPFLAVERGDANQGDSGWHCVALAIEPEHRERWRTRLLASGFPVFKETAYTLYVRDPEGNVVGLSHYPAG